MSGLRTPVAFFVFNRPELTAKVFERIAAQRPERLLIVADGPRAGRPGEKELCERTRAVVERIDWPCQVERDFSEGNLGCRRRMSSGIDWVFEQCESAILLEDDCVPEPTFFRYCEELLGRYADDERVSMIGGTRLHSRRRVGESYYFSRFPHIWGWATWRRSWKNYDVEMARWPELSEAGWVESILGDTPAARHWRWVFDETFAGRIDTWDYQWVLSCWLRDSLSTVPRANLISNLGFGPGATNTIKPDVCAELPTSPLEFPLIHPGEPTRSRRQDALTSREIFGAPEGGPTEQLAWRIRTRSRTLPASFRRMVSRLLA